MPVIRMLAVAGCAAVLFALASGPAAAAGLGCSTADETKALSFANAALVTDNTSQPNDVHLKKDNYAAGEPLRLFLVPAGYVCTQEGGGYSATLRLDVQVIYRGDVVLDQPNLKTFDFHGEEKPEVIRLNLDDKVDGLIPGAFALKATLADIIGGRSAEVILPFTVAP